MAKRRKDKLLATLLKYVESRTMDMVLFSDIHVRLTDGFTVMDVWPTTGKYYVLKTVYHKMSEKKLVERGGEKGIIPIGTVEIFEYLDLLFFAPDM